MKRDESIQIRVKYKKSKTNLAPEYYTKATRALALEFARTKISDPRVEMCTLIGEDSRITDRIYPDSL